jgi:anti-sigma-K factor RskA
MTREELQELASLHALGALPPEEARAFEEQLRSDPELRALHEELRDVTNALALSAPPVAPPPALKARILAAIDKPAPDKIIPLTQHQAGRQAGSNFIPWAVAACLVILVTIVFLNNTALRARLHDLAAEQDKSKQQTAMLQSALDELRAKDRVSQVRIAMLGSLLESSPKAVAVSVWDAEKQDGVLVVQNLAPLPADKDYQLWVIDPKQGGPVDAGVFTVDDKGTVHFRFKPRSNVNAAGTFAVTLEKKGGVPAPEGKMVLAGNLL